MALLCSPNLFSSQYQQLSFSRCFFSLSSSFVSLKFDERNDRSESRVSLNQRKCFCSASSPSSSSRPSPEMGVSRRDLMLFGLCSSLSAALPFSDCLAEDDLKMASMVDEINAYSYSYPMELQSKKFSFKWAESRKPERYSSAAPLSPDARLRIVSERVDFVDNLIISVTIGPPNVQFIKSKDKSVWNAKDVADSVLSDKSTLRVTSSQRLAESSLLDAHTTQVDGQPYWFYEYLVRKSPTKDVQEYRHYVASTAERDGYLYSLSASTLNRQWGKMGPVLERSVSSFRLLPPTAEYVPPFKDPWRFW
ncbi:PsbP domain-containing protein 5, chloroplastic [Linum perenne]